MRYVNKRMIVAINKLCIELSGGSPVSGNTNLSAGQNLGFVEGIRTNKIFGKKVYSSIFDQASAYFFYILKNHPFIDGNKRTALAVAITFLEWNGKFFAPMDDDDDVVDFVLSMTIKDKKPKYLIGQASQWFRGSCLH